MKLPRNLIAAVILTFSSSLSAQTFEVIYLHPAGAANSQLFSTTGTQQGGAATVGGVSSAGIWSGTAASFTNLHPGGPFTSSLITQTDGSQQGGILSTGGQQRGGLWSGTAGSFVDLTPIGADSAVVNAVAGGQQFGSARVGGVQGAGFWSGTAATFSSLAPVGSFDSIIYAAIPGRQGGAVDFDGSSFHAVAWTGTPGSVVDLHPPGVNDSYVYAMAPGIEAGVVLTGSGQRAALWRGTAASYVDLHPDGIAHSGVFGAAGQHQVGFVSDCGVSRATIWAGTKASAVDLQQFLPADYISSNARGVWTDGTTILVAGSAFNNTLARNEAVLWRAVLTPAPPAQQTPASLTVATKKTNRATFAITNPGSVPTTYRLSENLIVETNNRPPKSPKPPVGSPFVFRYSLGGQNVTRAIRNGTALVTLAPGETVQLQIRVKTKRKLAFKRRIRTRIFATNVANPGQTSVIATRLKLNLPRR